MTDLTRVQYFELVLGCASALASLLAVMFAAGMLDGLAGAPRYFYEYYVLPVLVVAVMAHLSFAHLRDDWRLGAAVSLISIALSYGIVFHLVGQPYRSAAIAAGAGVATIAVPAYLALRNRSPSYVRGVAAIGFAFAVLVAYLAFRLLSSTAEGAGFWWRIVVPTTGLLVLSGAWPLARVVTRP